MSESRQTLQRITYLLKGLLNFNKFEQDKLEYIATLTTCEAKLRSLRLNYEQTSMI